MGLERLGVVGMEGVKKGRCRSCGQCGGLWEMFTYEITYVQARLIFSFLRVISSRGIFL
jgi:hypothetical protein